MRIAILVWGSLFWDPKDLATTDEWFFDGPELPIEFARISSGNRLTLVIRPESPSVVTLYAISLQNDLAQARENLRIREGTDNLYNIGFIDFISNTRHARPNNQFVFDTLREWNANKNFDAIIWSDFAPRFFDLTRSQLNLANTILFIEKLSKEERREALRYIRNAPEQISTQFRAGIERHFTEF